MAKPEDDIEDSSAPLIEHLAELRTRLIRSVIAFMIAIMVFFIPVQGDFIAVHVLEFMLGPIEATLRDLGDPSPTLPSSFNWGSLPSRTPSTLFVLPLP